MSQLGVLGNVGTDGPTVMVLGLRRPRWAALVRLA
eukprot:SAG22_NODE_136_length_18095_cov_19.897255_27_plen_35_part_00